MKTSFKIIAASCGIALAVGVAFMSFRTNQSIETYQGPQMFVLKLAPAKLHDQGGKLSQKMLGSQANANLDSRTKGIIKEDDPTVAFAEDQQDGTLRFSKSLKKYGGDFKPNLPGEDKLEKIATKFLTENDLMPNNIAEMVVAHKGGLKAAKAAPDGKGEATVIDKMKTITYARTIDGVPVVGPGSKIIVNIGNDGDVTGLTHRWREVEKSGKQTVAATAMKPESQAKQEFLKKTQSDWGKNAKVNIKETKMAYYDSNDGYMQPVYVYNASITPDATFTKGQKSANQEYLGVIPAMKNAPESIFEPGDASNLKAGSYDAAKDKKLEKKTDEPRGRNASDEPR